MRRARGSYVLTPVPRKRKSFMTFVGIVKKNFLKVGKRLMIVDPIVCHPGTS